MYHHELSAELKQRAQKNVKFAREFNAAHPRANATNESFAEKLKRAVKKRKQANEQKEPARNRKPQPRERTKSE